MQHASALRSTEWLHSKANDVKIIMSSSSTTHGDQCLAEPSCILGATRRFFPSFTTLTVHKAQHTHRRCMYTIEQNVERGISEKDRQGRSQYNLLYMRGHMRPYYCMRRHMARQYGTALQAITMRGPKATNLISDKPKAAEL